MKIVYKGYEITIFSIKTQNNRKLWKREKIHLLLEQFYYELSMKHCFNPNKFWLDRWFEQHLF